MPTLSTNTLRELYLQFFESKGHTRIPSAPLVPENDPSVLFTTAGMHPLVPYLKGQPHPAGKRLVDAQKCLRTTDIDEVGDATHATVFEMLGNWSLGDYFKTEAITWSYEFLTTPAWLGIDPQHLAVTIFAGDNDAPLDTEAKATWQSLGIPAQRIAQLGKEDNWWPAGGKHPGPQGPDTEMFYWTGRGKPPQQFDPTDKNWVEIWNDVFMQYNRLPNGTYEALPQQNVDTGMGLERVIMALNGYASIYEADSYQLLLALINEQARVDDVKYTRILADHIKAFTFVLGDEVPVAPSNTDHGYVARRLIRRAVLAMRKLAIAQAPAHFLPIGMQLMREQYQAAYPSLSARAVEAGQALVLEIEKTMTSFERGTKKIGQILQNQQNINGGQAFELYATYGLPIEITVELAGEQQATVDLAQFKKELANHQRLSRTAAAGKFKGGLADHSTASIHFHTATHLLHQALRTVLGDHVLQKGSNITPERLRFDFSHPQKMTAEELQQIETLVNAQIAANLPVQRQEMTVAEAKELGALGLFEHKYGDKVSVYTIGNFSREICGGPHVEHTGILGKFKITKEEAAGAGIRRIKAVFER